MAGEVALNPTRLVIAAIIGLIILLVLIIKFIRKILGMEGFGWN